MPTVALVTGGNRGIGLATAQRLREDGFTVVVGSRSGAAPDGLDAVRLDVSVPESIEAAYAQIEEQFGPVGVLVANAGITRDTLLMRMSDDDIDTVLQTNLAGSIRLARRAMKGMIRAKSGHVIFVGSVVWALGSAGQVNYAAAKAGLVGAARSLAREVGSAASRSTS
jgi:3-oxoacyl-[acyl-carrier protein] reductase